MIALRPQHLIERRKHRAVERCGHIRQQHRDEAAALRLEAARKGIDAVFQLRNGLADGVAVLAADAAAVEIFGYGGGRDARPLRNIFDRGHKLSWNRNDSYF